MDFSNYKFRSSQVHLLMTGSIGVTKNQEEEIKLLFDEKSTGINVNGNKIKWTPTKDEKLKDLLAKQKNKELPKTMQSELRKIHRAEMHNRNFNFTNKFTQKGIVQEDEAITLYQNYLNRNGNIVLFTKNETRLKNDYITGLPDINPTLLNGIKTGFDVKSSWELETLPFQDDPLISAYDWQNQSYCWLTDSQEWITASCLVNIHEHGLNNEKLKYFYALGSPSSYEDEYYDEYVTRCKEIEVRLIFDYDLFVERYPYHNLEMSRDEWMETVNPATGEKGYDIDMVDRVVEKKTVFDESRIEDLKERIEIAREYLTNLK